MQSAVNYSFDLHSWLSFAHEGVMLCISFMGFQFKEDMTDDTLMLSGDSENLEPSFPFIQNQVTVNPHAT